MRGVASRGPHASDRWVSGRVGLGHHLLREVPEAEREAQPLTSPDGRFVIVFDGRIDNRDELFANLDRHLRPRLHCPDVEIVLAAHRCWGKDTPTRLLGDFAYAVWDTVEQSLVGVRDRLAGRPFFYVDRDEYFAFASRDEALLGLPGVTSAPNEDQVARQFLPTLNDYDQFTPWYADLSALKPGHGLLAQHVGPTVVSRYRTLSDAMALHFESDQEAIERFEAVLNTAIAARMRSFGPVGMLLSGGIDSASVISAARPLLQAAGRDPIRTYSAMADDETGCVESQAIRTLINAGVCTPTIVRTPSFDGGLSGEALARLVWGEAHPVDNSLSNHMSLFARAAADGCTSLLNGVGGDVTTDISGLYPAALLRQGAWRVAWTEAKAAAANNTYLRHLPAWRIFAQSLRAATPESAKARYRWLKARLPLHRQPPTDVLERIFSEDFIVRRDLRSRLRGQRRYPPLVTLYDPIEQQMKSLDWLAHGQSGYDQLAGRFGLTARDVWSDERLVRFYLGLPLSLRVGGGWTKSIVRASLRIRGQGEIANRTGKEHIGWTFSKRLLDDAYASLNGASASSTAMSGKTAGIDSAAATIFRRPLSGGRDSVAGATIDEFSLRATARWLERNQITPAVVEATIVASV